MLCTDKISASKTEISMLLLGFIRNASSILLQHYDYHLLHLQTSGHNWQTTSS